MARINIEDTLWRDNRFQELMIKVGSRHTAKGMILELFIEAQKFWLSSGGKGIPRPAWDKAGLPNVLIECGLAEDHGEFIYAVGSKEQFAWLTANSENGKKGGPAAAKSRRENKGKYKRPRSSKNVDSQPLSLSLSPSLTQNEEKKNTDTGESSNAVAIAPAQALPERKPKFSQGTRAKMLSFIRTYADCWKAKYNSNPEGIRDKTLIGKVGHWIECVSEERAINLAQVYLQVDYRPINESCHDLWQFFRHLNRIGIALDSGQDLGSINWVKVFA